MGDRLLFSLTMSKAELLFALLLLVVAPAYSDRSVADVSTALRRNGAQASSMMLQIQEASQKKAGKATKLKNLFSDKLKKVKDAAKSGAKECMSKGKIVGGKMVEFVKKNKWTIVKVGAMVVIAAVAPEAVPVAAGALFAFRVMKRYKVYQKRAKAAAGSAYENSLYKKCEAKKAVAWTVVDGGVTFLFPVGTETALSAATEIINEMGAGAEAFAADPAVDEAMKKAGAKAEEKAADRLKKWLGTKLKKLSCSKYLNGDSGEAAYETESDNGAEKYVTESADTVTSVNAATGGGMESMFETLG